MITIHNFPRGARGVRVFWVCEEMGLPYRTEAVKYPPTADYQAINPMGTAPFLQDDGGIAINESTAMMLYLAERYGPTPLLPPRSDVAAHTRVVQMTIFGEATLGAAMNPMLAAKFAAPEGEKDSWSVRACDASVARALDFAIRQMAGKPYIVGDAFTLADISVSCALDMWQGPLGKTVPDALKGWRERVQARPACRRAQAAQS
jgi:glutathione S-transferase